MNHVHIERLGPLGILVLSQPATLNALTLTMIRSLDEGLQSLVDDNTIKLVVIRSDSERAFCAGGDMKHIRQLSMDKDYAAIETFFQCEYALNLAIARCSKPYLAIIDGIAMGGGLGVSVHGRFRVVSERAVMAMPETRIGFFPDVGSSWFLPRLPHHSGNWLALTAATVKGMQAVKVGLATHHVSSDRLPALIDAIAQKLAQPSVTDTNAEAMTEQCLTRFADDPEADHFDEIIRARAAWFADGDAQAIRQRLKVAARTCKDAALMLTLLEGASPYSVRTTLELFHKAHALHLEACLQLELAAGREACRHPDLIEGVRAVLVDKDRKPVWADAQRSGD